MIFEADDVIERGEKIYRSFRILHGGENSYRQVYFANEGTLYDSKEKMVSLIVYDRDILPQEYASVPKHECDLLKNLEGGYFPQYLGYFEYERQGHRYMIIVTESYWSTTLREVITECGIFCPDNTRAQLLACVVKGVRSMMDQLGKVYMYDLSPDNILCYFNENGKVGIRFANLNLIKLGPEDDYEIDFDLIPADFCAPETIMGRFHDSSMQWSLAALAVYILDCRHPYGLSTDVSLYEAYLIYKEHPKPEFSICEGLNYTLKKALSHGVSYRLDGIDFLMDEILKYLSRLCQPHIYGNTPVFKPSQLNTTRQYDLHSIIDRTMECTAEDQIFIEEYPFDARPNNPPTPSMSTNANETTELRERVERAEVNFAILEGDGFKGIAGYETLKEQLTVDFLNVINNIAMAKRYGINPPGMLFFGAPGTGKTYIAEHLGQELGVEVSIIRPSTLGSIFVHGSQKLISDLFKQAEKKAKENSKGVLLVFDEVDAMTPSRTASDHNYNADEVAEFLTQLNNCSERGIYVIGTTNSIERMDPAVIRKGRLDKIVFFDLPCAQTRKKIFEYELNKLPHVHDLDLDKLAVMTEGYTSSDISFVARECARIMFARSLEQHSDIPLEITQEVLEETVLNTRPSVSQQDIRHYQKMYDKYVNANTSSSTMRVGFNIKN